MPRAVAGSFVSLCTWVSTLLAATGDQGEAATRALGAELPDAGTRVLARIRSCSTLAAVAFLGACSSEGAHKAEARELALAAGASEQITSDFAEQAFEAKQAHAQFDSRRKRWEETGFVEACPSPAVDASSWQRVSFEPFPITMTFPLGYKAPEQRTRTAARDTVHVKLYGRDGDIELFRGRGSDLHDDARYRVMSHCDDAINGSPVHIDSAIEAQFPLRKHVSATFTLPSGGFLWARASVRGVEAQAEALAAIRTLQFRYLWR
jgi:hypothetical protein